MAWTRRVVLAAALWALAGLSQADSHDLAPLLEVSAGTSIEVEFVTSLNSATSERGDTFQMRLAEPIVVDGQIAVAAGALATGEVVDARRADREGNPGILIVSGRYLEVGGDRAPINMTVVAHGPSNVDLVLGIWRQFNTDTAGGDVIIPLAARVHATLSEPLRAPAQTPVSTAVLTSAAPMPPAWQPAETINEYVGPPPSGQAQIVFFRPRRNSVAAYAYTVREGEQEIARLVNGSYVVVPVTPGMHEFSIGGTFLFGMRPTNTLRLEAQAEATYYVDHGIYALSPSGAPNFNSYLVQCQLVRRATRPPCAAE